MIFYYEHRRHPLNPNPEYLEPQAELSFGNISGSLIKSLLNSIDDHQMVADAALNYLSAGKLRASYLASITYPFKDGTPLHKH
jgi:hypothetical protein